MPIKAIITTLYVHCLSLQPISDLQEDINIMKKKHSAGISRYFIIMIALIKGRT